jgi:hypothetical protein
MTNLKRGDRARVHLYLQDEAPRLGCGWRLFDAHVGNKHVTLTNVTTGKSARLLRSVFEELARASNVQI